MNAELRQITVNGFTVNWSRAQLSKDNLTKPIEAKLLSILILLSKENGDIVSQQKLLDVVWPNTVVSPNTVQQSIAQLRKLLDDDGRSQKAIKTHPKLGYSLVFQIDKLEPVSLNDRKITPDSPRSLLQAQGASKQIRIQKKSPKNLLIAFGLFFLFLSLYFAFKPPLKKHTQLEIESIIPITVQGEVVQSVSLNQHSKTAYYLVKTGDTQSLRKQHIASANFKTLINNLKAYGTIAISTSEESLAFSQVSIEKNKKKCISLFILELSSLNASQLLPCSENFNHSPTWLNENTLVFIATDKQRNNQLYSLNIKTNHQQILPLNTKHIQSYALLDNQLAVISNGQLQVYELETPEKPLSRIHSQVLTSELQLSKLKWITPKELALFYDNTIHAIDFTSGTSTLKIANGYQLNDVLPIDSSSLLTIVGQQNWSVRERSIHGNKHAEIGTSDYRELNAKYKEANNEISYLSDRSGITQIWHQNQTGLMQLTDTAQPIKDYIWVFNHTSLLFISENKLWLQAKGLEPVSLNVELTPLRLYQSDQQHVLLSAKMANQATNNEVLIWLNVENKTWQVLLEKEVNWAQYINNNMFITNDHKGHLEKFVDGKRSAINSLPELTLQWRYFWRTNENISALYFQDKALNIWQFDPIADSAKIIGNYDFNSLFMTDYSARKHTMLSDNFVDEKQQLVTLIIKTMTTK